MQLHGQMSYADGRRCWTYNNNRRGYTARYALKGEAFDET